MSQRFTTRAKNTPGRPADPKSRRAIAERLTVELGVRVSQKMVREWEGKRFHLNDVKRLRRELATLQRPPGEDEPGDTTELREQILRAKLRRELAAAEKIELETATTRGELIEAAVAIAEMERLGRYIKSNLLQWRGTLPGQLVGLSTGEMSKLLDKETRNILTLFHEGKHYPGADPFPED